MQKVGRQQIRGLPRFGVDDNTVLIRAPIHQKLTRALIANGLGSDSLTQDIEFFDSCSGGSVGEVVVHLSCVVLYK